MTKLYGLETLNIMLLLSFMFCSDTLQGLSQLLLYPLFMK